MGLMNHNFFCSKEQTFEEKATLYSIRDLLEGIRKIKELQGSQGESVGHCLAISMTSNEAMGRKSLGF